MEFLLHFSYICSHIYENNETKEIENHVRRFHSCKSAGIKDGGN